MTGNQAWQQKETIMHYQRTADITIPKRKEILTTIAELATADSPDELNVLDLGCGTGDVAEEIVRIRPDASIYMLDYSESMVELAQDRFTDSGNVTIRTHDLNDGIPEDWLSLKFDAVTSCFALHHVEFENRVRLYTDIYQVLRNGGFFINGDIFIKESSTVTEWDLDHLTTWIVHQAKSKLGIERTFEQVKQKHLELAASQGDKPGTLQDMNRDLKQAGFRFVDCIWMENRHAIVTASDR